MSLSGGRENSAYEVRIPELLIPKVWELVDREPELWEEIRQRISQIASEAGTIRHIERGFWYFTVRNKAVLYQFVHSDRYIEIEDIGDVYEVIFTNNTLALAWERLRQEDEETWQNLQNGLDEIRARAPLDRVAGRLYPLSYPQTSEGKQWLVYYSVNHNRRFIEVSGILIV